MKHYKYVFLNKLHLGCIIIFFVFDLVTYFFSNTLIRWLCFRSFNLANGRGCVLRYIVFVKILCGRLYYNVFFYTTIIIIIIKPKTSKNRLCGLTIAIFYYCSQSCVKQFTTPTLIHLNVILILFTIHIQLLHI